MRFINSSPQIPNVLQLLGLKSACGGGRCLWAQCPGPLGRLPGKTGLRAPPEPPCSWGGGPYRDRFLGRAVNAKCPERPGWRLRPRPGAPGLAAGPCSAARSRQGAGRASERVSRGARRGLPGAAGSQPALPISRPGGPRARPGAPRRCVLPAAPAGVLPRGRSAEARAPRPVGAGASGKGSAGGAPRGSRGPGGWDGPAPAPRESPPAALRARGSGRSRRLRRQVPVPLPARSHSPRARRRCGVPGAVGGRGSLRLEPLRRAKRAEICAEPAAGPRQRGPPPAGVRARPDAPGGEAPPAKAGPGGGRPRAWGSPRGTGRDSPDGRDVGQDPALGAQILNPEPGAGCDPPAACSGLHRSDLQHPRGLSPRLASPVPPGSGQCWSSDGRCDPCPGLFSESEGGEQSRGRRFRGAGASEVRAGEAGKFLSRRQEGPGSGGFG
ncbi:uncharacterized protein [Lepidochelys kempii]|uniref:uncharacterized protein n=1 Tax=Lepidochelys kempii TaxID=8472 RepID=UPI003C6F9D1D